ncbi:MAG: class I SAM-dependent methyltransferase [Bacteroidales bacterium]
MSVANISQFVELFSKSLSDHSFVRLAFKNKRNKTLDLNTVTVKIIEVKDGIKLSFVYRYPTKDITKNYSFDESTAIIDGFLKNDFLQADLFTLTADYYLTIHKNNIASIRQKTSSISEIPQPTHDKEKNRMITTKNNIYLKELGITGNDGEVKKNMQDKYRQINKYIEIIDGILRNTQTASTFNIVDMGAGKGYLTFALYDYLYNVLHKTPNVIGVELRKELVENCNLISQHADFPNLSFKTGTIKDVEIPATDMLIALHACDTATDDAIFRGIQSDAKVIVCAPCCHKQLRKQMHPTDDLSLISQFGILKERQAELLTDAIRALLMEAYGYKTNVFEFIATEHTPKNVLIVGVKQKKSETPNEEILHKIQNIKNIHGIEYHYLENLLKNL